MTEISLPIVRFAHALALSFGQTKRPHMFYQADSPRSPAQAQGFAHSCCVKLPQVCLTFGFDIPESKYIKFD